jgi:glycosyltransferase involved in cell wall biosynthesis
VKVAINALAAREGGSATYAQTLLEGIPEVTEHRFLMFLPPDVSYQEVAAANLEIRRPHQAAGRWGRMTYEHFHLTCEAARWGADVLYAFSDTLPLRSGGVPAVLGHHNADIYSPESWERGWMGQCRIRVLRFLGTASVRKALGVITMSDAARGNFERWCPAKPARMAVVRHAAPREMPSHEIEKRDERMLLCVSGIYAHKNIHRLVDAFFELAHETAFKEFHLVVAGKIFNPGYFMQLKTRIQKLGLSGHVRFTGPLSYEETLSYYRKAALLVFPSRLETFGYPVLEAMALRTPMALSDLPVFRETAGDGAVYFDPCDVQGMASAMRTMLTDSVLRREKVERAGRIAFSRGPADEVRELTRVFQDWTSHARH